MNGEKLVTARKLFLMPCHLLMQIELTLWSRSPKDRGWLSVLESAICSEGSWLLNWRKWSTLIRLRPPKGKWSPCCKAADQYQIKVYMQVSPMTS
jgi:hypothetical protein